MLNLIKTIKRGKLWSLPGGIHPPIRKEQTQITQLPSAALANELVIPLLQHIGDISELIVKKGDYVLKGQPLTQSKEAMSPPVHAPTSGTISAIEKRPSPHPMAMDELAVILSPDNKETWKARDIIDDISTLSHQQIVDRIHQAGVTGMGGASFPAAIKCNETQPISCLIINGAECEPFIQADDALMQTRAQEIMDGIMLLVKILQPELVILAIEDDKQFAIQAIREVIGSPVRLHIIPTLYPSGGERQLIQLLTGLEVPSGGIPADIGVLVHNVATCYAIKRAVINDEPLIERVITLAGGGFNQTHNIMVPLGTPIHSLLREFAIGTTASQSKLIIGGPMMGITLPHAQIPVTKGCNAILLDSNEVLTHSESPHPCIRCGQCADVCPANLLPQSLYWHAKNNELEQLEKLNLPDCIECGACAYVCPSKLPLVLHYRQAKAQLRQQQLDKQSAQIAKQRFDARQLRLEREKQQREAKHKAAAQKRIDAMKASADNTKGSKDAGSDPVAAALARVKAKKAAQQTNNAPQVTSETSDATLNREARKAQARQYKAQKAQQSGNDEPQNNAVSDPKSQVAAAIARAKAKKAAQQQTQTGTANAQSTASAQAKPEHLQPQAPQKTASKADKVAAAIARAKAKKAAQQQTAPKADKVAAAIARAKAKKAAQQQTHTGTANVKSTASAEAKPEHLQPQAPQQTASKADRVAAAIARAKAKKAAQRSNASSKNRNPNNSEPN